MTINNNSLKKFALKATKFVLVGTLSTVMLTLPGFMTKAQAVEPQINPHGYYDVSTDGYYLDIYGEMDYSFISNMKEVEEVFVSNATIDESFQFSNKNISHLTFKNCIFSYADFKNFKNVDAYTFIGCKFDSLDFLKQCQGITFLDIDSCEVGNVDAIKDLTNLECLNFYDVGIENINFLKNNKKLEQLVLSNTCVTDLSPIANSNIKELDISNTLTIQDLSPVMTLKKLRSFISLNCEMSYTPEFYNYIAKNRIYTNIEKSDLEIKGKVEKISKQIINKNMTVDEKINTIINYVVDNIEYDYGVETDEDLSMEYNEHALRYALEGTGCCRNYTALTTALMQINGIEAYEIKGDNHIWNIVEIDGEFYWIDSTWLDGLEDVEILDSKYYMNDNYLFVDHEPLTRPTSMYQNMNNVYNEESEPVTQIPADNTNNNNNSNNFTDTTNKNTFEESTTKNNEIEVVENLEEDITTSTKEQTSNIIDNEINTTPSIELNSEKEQINENSSNIAVSTLKAKKACAAAIVGIAVALGFSKVANVKKKQKEKAKTK